MKESKYNISIEYKNQQLLFNSRTIATASLDTEAIDILKAVRNNAEIKETDLVKQMKQVGFLIDDGVDELQQLEMNYNFSKYQKSGLMLVLAPTMACNFACPYCYEGAQRGLMSEKLQDNIVSLASKFAKESQNIHVTWFGGEPLLAKASIYNMSEKMLQICQQEQVNYEAEVITNGYLLDEETILRLKQYKVESIQVTIDGLPATHNKKRRLKDASESSTFEQILNNIICAKGQGIRVAIRVNVDRETEKELEQLLELMIENGLGEELYLGRIQGNTDSSKAFSDNCLNEKEFASTSVAFENLKFSKKLQTGYPVPTRISCGADYLYSYVIDADGYMYKCWNDIGLKECSIGTIDSFDMLLENPNQNYSKYITWSPFHFDKCRKCKLLPICMGGCQFDGRAVGAPICENWKYELEEYIKLKCDAANQD